MAAVKQLHSICSRPVAGIWLISSVSEVTCPGRVSSKYPSEGSEAAVVAAHNAATASSVVVNVRDYLRMSKPYGWPVYSLVRR